MAELSWLKRLLGRNTETSVSEQPSGADAVYHSNQDIVDGVEFIATLQLRTPYHILERHGQIFMGLPSKAPQYGDSRHGMWLVKLKSWGVAEMDEIAARSPHASDIGPIIAEEYLPFLKAFRQIVETNNPVAERLAQVELLATRSGNFKEIFVRLSSSYEDFPASYFYRELTELPGIGIKSAKLLFDKGLHTKNEIQSASQDTLLSVTGIGKKTIEKLKGNQS